MSKAIRFGIAAGLALTAFAPAWAGDEKSDEKVTIDTASGSESASAARITATSVDTSGTGSAVEAGSGTAMPMESKEVRASFEERWLRDREGYRDGGY